MEFIELPSFTRAIQEAHAEESLRQLQLELITNPEKGPIVKDTGGFRKIRLALPGRGKSGSARAIYFYLAIETRIVFAMFYLKAKTDTLSHEQKKRLRMIAEELRK